jgi:hypothetical protein
MVNICIEYTGDLHCDAVHGPSHTKIGTDAPTDNKAKVNLFAHRSVATCMSTILAITAQDKGDPERVRARRRCAVSEYKKAMEQGRRPLKTLISRQYTEVKSAHDRVRDLRDAKS